MSEQLAIDIEAYLLTRGDWVSVDEICQFFGIVERMLRASGSRRPLCSRFAISSSTRGLKHISLCTVSERLQYKHARRKVLVAYARALRDYQLALDNCLTGKFPRERERFTEQGVLFPL